MADPNKHKITRNTIYHRLEWFFKKSHDPSEGHSIPPVAPISALWRNFTLVALYESLNEQQTSTPAWNGRLFDGVEILWDAGNGPGAVGIKDVRTFGDLTNCVVYSYRRAGWAVT